MEITPEQLLFLRKQRGLTREELAKELDCSAGAIVQWERSTRSIPSWVADKMFSKLPITFTVQELAELYELCREEGCSMSELIQDSVRMRIEERRAASQTKGAQNITYYSQHEQSSRVAEDPPKPRKKNGTED